MKCILVVCLLSLVALSIAAPDRLHRVGCIWVMGECLEKCPKGTHEHFNGCNKKMPEATCDQPNPVRAEHMICEFDTCYCDPPTVRNTVTKQCVNLDQCPRKE